MYNRYNSHHIMYIFVFDFHQWSTTPMDVASANGHLHIACLLSQRGAMMETRDVVRQS